MNPWRCRWGISSGIAVIIASVELGFPPLFHLCVFTLVLAVIFALWSIAAYLEDF